MIIIYDYALGGYQVIVHGKWGLKIIACDVDRVVAISKAFSRLNK